MSEESQIDNEPVAIPPTVPVESSPNPPSETQEEDMKYIAELADQEYDYIEEPEQ